MTGLRLIIGDGLGDAWRERAACLDTPSDLFFPDARGRTVAKAIAPAQRICARCPVRAECYDYGVATNAPTGVWGGQPFGDLLAKHQRRLRRLGGVA